MPKRDALGRGLDNIFSENTPEDKNGVVMLRLSDIEPKKDQPRKDFKAEPLSELADSIAVHGVLQPIIVRDTGRGMYEIIAGERRWRAARLAGLDSIPAMVMEADELKAAQVALIENIQRENLNPFEEAAAYNELIRTHGMSKEELAAKLGKSRGAVSNTIRLLNLPDEVAAMIRDGKLSAAHGRTLLGLKDPSVMIPLANKIIKRNLSVRETEAAVKRENRITGSSVPSTDESDSGIVNYISELERKISSACGRQVKIITGRGRSAIQIEYTDNEDLDDIIRLICGEPVDM